MGQYSKILVIDDDETVLEIVNTVLKDAGYAVECFSDGPAGLKRAATYMPSAIILDRNMPVMNGNQILKELKDNPHTAQIPVIMLTGDAEHSNISQNLEMGARDYIVKPFDPNALLLRLRNTLRSAL